jgi:DNA repair exonuclease SbcCD nuclease subunit
MAFAPLRFLHAADARLDQAIGEIPKLPPRLAAIVQDATRAAFDRFIALAIEHEVDFVLLAGNTFVEADQSLSARLSLLDGFEQLDRSGIQALILPGTLDPLEAWRRIPDLPENVTLLEPHPKGIVAVRRDDKVVARVGTELFMPARKKARTLRDDLRSVSQRPVPFKIAAIQSGDEADDAAAFGDWCPEEQFDVAASASDDQVAKANTGTGRAGNDKSGRRLPVDYVALGGGAARRTIARRRGLAHDPGPLQGRGADQAGPRGCTLVTVEQDGTLRCDFLPAASVRWERFLVEVPSSFDRAELLARCRAHLDGLRPEACENAWIFQWVLHGSRPTIDVLEDESFRRQFRHDLAKAAAVPSSDDSMHQLIVEADENSIDPGTVDPLQADFLEALSARRGASDLFRPSVNDLRAADAHWGDRLDGLLSDLNEEAIRTHADRIGQQLFRAAIAQGAVR